MSSACGFSNIEGSGWRIPQAKHWQSNKSNLIAMRLPGQRMAFNVVAK
jgi:hypothetical protein